MIHADVVLVNGRIFTLDERQPRASALAVASGRILAVGHREDLESLIGPSTRLHNLNGAAVIPGLIDSHIHWEMTSRALDQVNLHDVPTREEAVRRVAERAKATPPGQWIIGFGWFQDLWPDRAFPSGADLDPVTPAHPVFLQARSAHAAWVNSQALRLCQVTASTPDPVGGQIVRDASGQPTGLLLEGAMNLIEARIPPPTSERLADLMARAQQAAHAVGLTAIHDFDGPSSLRALQILRERDRLGLRVVKQIRKDWLEQALDLGIRGGLGDEWIRFGALKLFADGALGPRTAHMIEPYEGEPDNIGIVVTDREEMTELVSRASAAGLPSTIHAIGDRAVHDVLDVFEIVRGEEAARGESPVTRRHRIEHVQLIHPSDVHRLAELSIIASIQPIHATADMLAADRYWGARSRLAYNARVQLDQGVMVAFGSDSPIEPFDPFKGIHAAVTRRRPDGSPGPDGWYPQARLTVEEALYAYTVGPAYAGGLEHIQGRLAPGCLADCVVLDRSPFAISPDELLDVRVLATMVGGRWVHGQV